MAETVTGGCFCKGIRFTLSGPIRAQTHCHCESCRKATSSAFTTWLTLRNADVRFSGLARSIYSSRSGITRTFCPRCGSQLTYEWAEKPENIYLYAASLDDQRSVKPTLHYSWSEHVPWVELGDDLPREG